MEVEGLERRECEWKLTRGKRRTVAEDSIGGKQVGGMRYGRG